MQAATTKGSTHLSASLETLKKVRAKDFEALYNSGDMEGFLAQLKKFSLYLLQRFGVVASQEEIDVLLVEIQSVVIIKLLERPCREGGNFTTYVYSMIRNILTKYFYIEVKRRNTSCIDTVQVSRGESLPFLFDSVISDRVTETFCLEKRGFDAYLRYVKNEDTLPFLTVREEGIYKALSRVVLWRAFV